jgi:hypothetical protein
MQKFAQIVLLIFFPSLGPSQNNKLSSSSVNLQTHPAFRLTLPNTWSSGIYVAEFRTGQEKYSSEFIIEV